MDSLTQAVLGAAIGEATLGRKVGRKAAAWGGVLGTLPDLDVLIPRGGPVADFTYHRTETHSLFWLTLAAPLVAWALHRLHRDAGVGFRQWWLMCWLVLITHPLLDVLTIYGTQLGLPFTNHPFGAGSVFVIDPAYTLPLLAGLLSALLMRRDVPTGHRLNTAGLALGTAYLAFGLAAQQYVEGYARHELDRQGLMPERLFATPTPLNGILWRIVSVDGDRYCEGFRSLLDGDAPFGVRCHERGAELLEPLDGTWAADRLRWFTKGWYAAQRMHAAESGHPQIVFRDLRMGQEPNYVFSFVLADVVNGRVVPRVPASQLPLAAGARNLQWVWRRISDPAATTPAP